MAQIGCNMTDVEAELLNDYAASLGLTRPAMCSLLVQRELRKPRLRRIRPSRGPKVGSDGPRRVTVHLRNADFKSAFTDHVRSLGLGSDEAAAILFRHELKERWLFNMFGLEKNRG